MGKDGKGPVDEFNVVIDNDKKVFRPGEVLSGKVEVKLSHELKLRGIVLEFNGEALLQWTEGSGETRSHYFNRVVYLEKSVTLIEKG